jgi:hypothetical protein
MNGHRETKEVTSISKQNSYPSPLIIEGVSDLLSRKRFWGKDGYLRLGCSWE